MTPPVPYSPDLETPEEGEAETVQGIRDALHEVMETVAADEGRARRAVHAKGHGYVSARVEILADLPPELAQGLFARPGGHGAILRFSTNPGDVLDDSVSVPRGLALKVLEVEGERLPGSEGERTQDFVLVNGPAFSAGSAKAFLGNLRLLAKTTDRAQWAKKALSAALRTTERALEAVGLESAAIKTLGGAPNVHPLGEAFYSQTAFRHGSFVAKYAVVPRSASLVRHHGEEIDAGGRPDAIREAMARDADMAIMEWELRAQLLRNRATMPVEDPTVEWDQEESPYLAVARIRAEPQAAWTEARDALDDGLRFSPWTGLAAHRPLGVINRVRRDTYADSALFREHVNRCPVREPVTADLPS